MPLVLVQNPVIVNQEYEWKDIVGEQYHFPNQYKNRCTPGSPFVYYRGTRRANGKRAVPEYFGHARIGTVWRDEAIPESQPKKDWAWYCSITDYVPFPNPVPAKIEGTFLETIARNHWSVGIRPLPQEIYDTILRLAGISAHTPEDVVPLRDFATMTIAETGHSLLLPRKPLSAGVPDLPGARYSKNALLVGRWAEEVAHRFLQERAVELSAKNIRWVAREGLTPGWDFQYDDESGQMVAVEVKGTTAPMFGSIDITAGEWNAALALGDHYWIYLVADCCTTAPVIQRLQNPGRLVHEGRVQLVPIAYRFSTLIDTKSCG